MNKAREQETYQRKCEEYKENCIRSEIKPGLNQD